VKRFEPEDGHWLRIIKIQNTRKPMVAGNRRP
jgi:hypothetical protein